ncbi:hypothetical protein NDA18_002263 [Ustilago nuda]|nr:hypothetical protein NDA18_002263 [Ustilago nuda]
MASRSASNHDYASAFANEPTSSASSHSSSSLHDRRVLQPDDFKRSKNQLSSRSRPASRIDYIANSGSTSPAALISHIPRCSQGASPLPPNFDLVFHSRHKVLVDLEGGNRETFGSWNEDAEGSEDQSHGVVLTDPKEELATVAGEALDDESIPVQPQPELAPASSSSPPSDAHLTQLKQEADEVWNSYRPGMTPQQSTVALESELDSRSNASDQPANIPQRVTSLRRNSTIVLTSLLKHDSHHQRDSVAIVSSQYHASSSQVHDRAVPSARSARPEFETFPRITTSISSGASFRGPSSSDMHFQRPYTASILSFTSEGSFLSYQNSFESGISPLLLNRTPTLTRMSGRIQRPATSGSIPYSASAELNFSRPLPSPGMLNRPETSNQLTAEERRQQVRRTKKLTQMLGEEMLLAPNTSRSLGPSVDSSRNKKCRPQSMPFNNDPVGMPSSAPPFGSMTGSKTRALSRKLLTSRSQLGKSWGHAFAGLDSAPVQGLNRKAAAILGLPHPYSSNALNKTTGVKFLESEDVLEEINPTARPFIPTRMEGFNEPTPKVAQLIAFSAAALDGGAPPTLPQDGVFRPFDSTHLDRALAMSESRKLAAARDARRRRVAKISRWLGEAVPAELIHSGTRQSLNSVTIRSTGAPVSSDPSLMSHDSDYTVSNRSCARLTQSSSPCNSSSLAHRSLSHESSVASGLQSFMSIDSSDDEDDSVAVSAPRGPLAERRSAGPSPLSNTAALPVTSDSIYSYRNSIESYEYLLDHDHERLSELASIFHDTRIPIAVANNTTTVDTVVPRFTRPPRSAARSQTSGSTVTTHPDPIFSRLSQTYSSAGHSPATRPITSASVGDMSRRSAAFLELSDSESDSSEAEELYSDEFDFSPSTIHQRRMDSHDRSISKLSNFFGSTPSQIVRSQSVIRAATSSADSISTVEIPISATAGKMGWGRGRAPSQPDALKTILRSLGEKTMDDSKLTSFQKSEISRKVHLLRKRTTEMFA